MGALDVFLYARMATVAAYLNLSHYPLEHQQSLCRASATGLSQASIMLGVPIDVAAASHLGDSSVPGGFQDGQGILPVYGPEGSEVWDTWGPHQERISEYVANVLLNIRKMQNAGLFFFTPLFLLVLSMWEGRVKWLKRLTAYRDDPSAMDAAINDIFSARAFGILHNDWRCVPIQCCSWVLCSYWLWRRTNANKYINISRHRYTHGRVFDGDAAAFVERLHDAMAANGIGRPSACHHYSDFIPDLVVGYVQVLMRYLHANGIPEEDDAARGKFLYNRYRRILLPRGQKYAEAWSIPYPHELMVGEGKLLRMWADVSSGGGGAFTLDGFEDDFSA